MARKFASMRLAGLLLFFQFICFAVSAQLPGWQYSKPVLVQNREGRALTDYQISITLRTDSLISTGKLLPDLRDLRLTDSDGTSMLCFWPEVQPDGQSVKLWVKVPRLAAHEKRTLYLCYGNPHAEPGSDAACTFTLFDDFRQPELDHTLWEVLGHAEPELKQGRLVLKAKEGDQMIRPRYSLPRPLIVEMKVDEAQGNLVSLAGLNRTELGWVSGHSLTFDALSQTARMDLLRASPCGGYDPDYGHSMPQTSGETKGIWSMAWVTDNQVVAQWPGGSIIEPNVLLGAQELKFALGIMACNTNEPLQGKLSVDWVRVRQFTLNEPQVTLGPETMAGPVAPSTGTPFMPVSSADQWPANYSAI